MSPPRASEEERQWFAELLQRHFVDGRLDSDELDARLEKVFAARTLEELYATIADLPHLPAIVSSSMHARDRTERRSLSVIAGRVLAWWRHRRK
ncbi:MAG: DUF1707 domain-containing protein [Actinobacteria bacterium]|nr:DUF1707 domain-containing protein [Actinomycetota bacterium]MCL5447428.1 DUF1707 domain-containing protein [Actinomycetota bacterium]